MHETIKEPQLPKHERGLDVTLRACILCMYNVYMCIDPVWCTYVRIPYMYCSTGTDTCTCM